MKKRCGHPIEGAISTAPVAGRASAPDVFRVLGSVADRTERAEPGREGVEARPAPVGVKAPFFATLATRSRPDSPLIFDIVAQGKVYLVAFALAERVDGKAIVSSLNAPLWAPLKALVGKRVVQPRNCSSVQDIDAALNEVTDFDSGTCFLVSCDNMDAIAAVVRRIDPFRIGSSRVH
jgi:hypothetical protein